MKTKTLLGAVAVLLAGGCGQGLKCGDGTFKSGDKCLAYDPDDETAPTTTLDPAGGKSRTPTPSMAWLTTDEPALIYWSIDGSVPDPAVDVGHPSPALVTDLANGDTVTYFAVDAAGNQETTRTSTFLYDPNPPARVSLSLEVAGADAEVSWTNPADADYTGTILARVENYLDAQPEEGEFYTAGMVLSSNVEIVQVGTQTSFSDAGVGPGDVRYVAWTFDDIANYSAPASVRGQAIGSTAGTLSIDVTANTVTVTNQPPYLQLSGTSSFAAGTLTVNLTVENLTTKYFQSPKILVTSVAGTTGSFSNSDGTIDGMGTKYYGPNHLSPGDMVTRTLTFTGVLVTDVVVVDVAVVEHPFLMSAIRRTNPTTYNFTDSRLGGLGNGSSGNGANDGPGGSRGMARPGCASPDGRYFYTGSQHFGGVDRYDLSIRASAGSVQFPTARLSSTLLCDDDSDGLYAILVEGGRRGEGTFDAHRLVKLDRDLTELASVEFSAEKVERGVRGGSISPGGRYVAVHMSDQIVFIDTHTMSVIDMDLSTSEVDHLATNVDGGGHGIRHSAWSPDGKTLYAQGWYNSALAEIEMPNGPAGVGITVTVHGDDGCCSRVGEIEVAPDGRVWITNDIAGLQVYDPAQVQLSTLPYGLPARGLEILGDEIYVLRQSNRQTVDVVDMATGVSIPGRTLTLPTQELNHKLVSSKTGN